MQKTKYREGERKNQEIKPINGNINNELKLYLEQISEFKGLERFERFVMNLSVCMYVCVGSFR